MTTEFVDISSHNGPPNYPIDLHAYKADGHQHLSMKVIEGTGYCWFEGAHVASDWHKLGGDVIHYAWVRYDQDPVAQAEYFVQQVRPRLGNPPSNLAAVLAGLEWPDGDCLMSDVEAPWESGAVDADPRARRRQVRLFDARVQQLLPEYPLLDYIPDWYMQRMPALGRWAAKKRRLVVASDYSHADPGNTFGCLYVAHQTTSTAHVPGFRTPVDLNHWLVGAPGSSTPPTPPIVPPPPNDGKPHPWQRIAWQRSVIDRKNALIARLRARLTRRK